MDDPVSLECGWPAPPKMTVYGGGGVWEAPSRKELAMMKSNSRGGVENDPHLTRDLRRPGVPSPPASPGGPMTRRERDRWSRLHFTASTADAPESLHGTLLGGPATKWKETVRSCSPRSGEQDGHRGGKAAAGSSPRRVVARRGASVRSRSPSYRRRRPCSCWPAAVRAAW